MGSGNENEIGTVVLSLVLSEANGAAKHLDAYRERSFAALRVTTPGRFWSFNFIIDPLHLSKITKISSLCVICDTLQDSRD